MRRQTSGARQGLAAGGRALAFMLNKMGNHWKALHGGRWQDLTFILKVLLWLGVGNSRKKAREAEGRVGR